MSRMRCGAPASTRSLRITVCTNAPAPAASSSRLAHGTVSPASTTDAPAYSIAEADGGLDRPVVGGRDADPDTVACPRSTPSVYFVDLHRGRLGDVGVVGDR